MRPVGPGSRPRGGGGVTRPRRPCSCGGDSAPALCAAHRGSSRGTKAAGRSPRGGARSCSGAGSRPPPPPRRLLLCPRSTGAAPPRPARAPCRPLQTVPRRRHPSCPASHPDLPAAPIPGLVPARTLTQHSCHRAGSSSRICGTPATCRRSVGHGGTGTTS